MEMKAEMTSLLRRPFKADEIEWRVQSAGRKKDGSVWARIVPYVTNRAIMDRLDETFGIDGWKSEFRDWHGVGAVCRLSYKIGDEWLYHEDGANLTEIEPVKGGISNAMKRAAVHLGIGRYLYNLGEYWADVKENGSERASFKDGQNRVRFRYDVPQLPTWALPPGEVGSSGKQPTGEARKIGTEIWGILNANDEQGGRLFSQDDVSTWWRRVQSNLENVGELKMLKGQIVELAEARRGEQV